MNSEEKKEAARIDKLGEFLQKYSRVTLFVEIVFLLIALVSGGWPVLLVLAPLLVWAVVWTTIMISMCVKPKKDAG